MSNIAYGSGASGGTAAGVAAAAAVGAGEGAAFQVGDNVVSGRDWREGVGQAALIGGVSAGVLSGAGELLGSAGDDAAAFCGQSFAADTPVATPDGGERPIALLRVGDAVEAYDPSTDKTSVQQVQHVFVNHDTDLLDVTLRTSVSHAKPAAQPVTTSTGASASERHQGRITAHGSVQQKQSQPDQQQGQLSVAPNTPETEIIHTTANHPWLTVDQGWERAGVLRVGEPVVTANGSTAVVVATRVVPGTAAMWDLTVSNVHTFAVGASQFVVHNCTPEQFEQGARQAKQIMRDKYGYDDTDIGRFKGPDNPDTPNINSDPRVSPERYYLRFRTPYGDVKISGNFDPATGTWDDDFHLSRDQPSDYWRREWDFWNP